MRKENHCWFYWEAETLAFFNKERLTSGFVLVAFGLSRGKNGGKYLNGITSGRNIPRPTTSWMYKTLVNVKNCQNPQLVGPRQISGSRQQEIHQAWSYCWWQPEIRCEKTSCSHYLWRILYIQPTINSMGGIRVDGFHGKNLRPPNLSEAAEAFLAQHVAKAEWTKALETLCRFGREVHVGGGTGFFHGFLNLQDGAPKKPVINGVDLSSEVRFCSPQWNPFSFRPFRGDVSPHWNKLVGYGPILLGKWSNLTYMFRACSSTLVHSR